MPPTRIGAAIRPDGSEAQIRPGAEPIRVDAAGPDAVGVLLIHGFTGSPAAWRPLAGVLADRGHAVRVPLLPGHGTRWQDANSTSWRQWYETVEAAFDELQATTRAVVVAGLSMGGALALRLAQQRGSQLAGLVLVNPAIASADQRLRLLPVLRRIGASLPSIGSDIAAGGGEVGYDRTPLHALATMTGLWRVVCADLTRVTQPLLLFRSRTDHVVDQASAALIRTWTRPVSAEWVTLLRSYHVATLDHDAPEIAHRTTGFVDRVTRPDTVAADPGSPVVGKDS